MKGRYFIAFIFKYFSILIPFGIVLVLLLICYAQLEKWFSNSFYHFKLQCRINMGKNNFNAVRVHRNMKSQLMKIVHLWTQHKKRVQKGIVIYN